MCKMNQCTKCECCKTRDILGFLLDAYKESFTLRKGLEDLLSTEIDEMGRTSDYLAYAGMRLLGVNPDSQEGDRFFYTFFGYGIMGVTKEETIENLLDI